MSKTAQQKMNEFWNESDKTRSVIKDMSDKSFEAKGSFSYAAGVLESILVDAIMELPKARREYYRQHVEKFNV